MQDVYQIITDRLLVILEAGTVPWRKPWNYGREKGPSNLVSRKHYQGINCFLLACSAFGSPYWLTFRQELVAEMAAAFLYGYGRSEVARSWQYPF